MYVLISTADQSIQVCVRQWITYSTEADAHSLSDKQQYDDRHV